MLEETPITDELPEENLADETTTQPDTNEPTAAETPADQSDVEIASVLEQLAELKDKHLRLMAEFDTFRRRAAKEKNDLRIMAARDTITALLPVFDDFNRAEANGEIATDGIRLVYNKFQQVLKSCGVEVMQSTGLDFDPNCHEAVTEIPAPTDELKGKVIDTIEQGYLLHGQIIRFAKVVVGA